MNAYLARGRAAALVMSAAIVMTACSSPPLTQPSWGPPEDPMGLAQEAGLQPTDHEDLTTHIHTHVSVYVDGVLIEVPAGIGIDTQAETGVASKPTDDGTATEWFVTTCDAPCLSPLHTHDPSGVIHTESPDPDQEPFTLGQFFTEWGVALGDLCVGEFCEPDTTIDVYVNGQKNESNPSSIKLAAHDEIAIIIGRPPNHIPDSHIFLPGT
jgi:hypothetical protein